REVMSLQGLCIERLQHAPAGVAAVAGAGDGDVVATGIDDDAEPPFDQRQVLTVGADQRGCGTVVVEVDDDLGFGRNLHVAVKFAAGSERRRIRCTFWQGLRLPEFLEGNWFLEKNGSWMKALKVQRQRRRVGRAGCNARGSRS